MKNLSLLLATLLIILNSCGNEEKKQETEKGTILIFSETQGFRHSSIEVGREALSKICKEKGFQVDSSENSSIMTRENLSKYAAVIFLNTTGDILTDKEQKAFEEYMRQGGSLLGIHSATDTEYEWPWYGKLIGAYFDSHPKQQEAKIKILNKTHLSTQHLPDIWVKWDEWYNFKNLNPEVNVLAVVDETSYEGGKNGENHPVSWYQEFEGGKMFYTALGHTEESYSNPDFIKHLAGGLDYLTK